MKLKSENLDKNSKPDEPENPDTMKSSFDMFGSSSSVKMYLTRLSKQIRSKVKQNVKSVCVATKNPAI